MAVAFPEQITVAFQAAYNARDKNALMRLYARRATQTFDGMAIHSGFDAISMAFDGGFSAQIKLAGEVLTCLVAADLALLRVRWQSYNRDGSPRNTSISCEVLQKGADGLWRYILDDATGGSRDSGANSGG